MASVEVKVQEPKEQAECGSLHGAMRKLFLAGVGAVVMAQEAVAGRVNTLVERGERIQDEGRQRMRDRMDSRKHQIRKIASRRNKGAETAEATLQTRIEAVLGRTEVPTRSDIEALSAKISALSEKLDELNSVRRQPAKEL
jgi:poly(hydroxyalkanoate) granule-associated protein